MRTMTITIENVPEGIFNTIWEAARAAEGAPPHVRRKVDVEPTTDISINYGEGQHANKAEICTSLTGLVCTHVIMDMKKRGKI